MKNLMLSLAFASAITTLSAQNKIEKKPVSDFNKWSIELAGGVNKPQRPMSSSYFTSTPSPYVADLGVRYYLDEEPNTISGVMVNTKGKSIDLNNNNVPDELESYLLKTYGSNTDKSPILGNNELIKNLINGGYVCTYFDFGKSTPTNVSTEGIDFILNYLRNNPSASVDIIGHADEIGKSAYNDKLAASRANSVKNVLEKAKINPSRLNIVSAGEDTSVEKDSDAARKLVRKVTFRVK